MATSTGSGSPSLDTVNNLFGTSLEFPKCFRKPGTSSMFEAKAGSGHLGTRGGTLEVNPGPLAPFSVNSLGSNVHTGIDTIIGALTVNGATLFNGVVNGLTGTWNVTSGSYSVTSKGQVSISSKGAMKISSGGIMVLAPKRNLSITAPNMLGNGTVMTGFDISACTGKKPFDIPHPTKDGWRLRHVCIEGPSADVYVRGTLNNSNIIELPEYWIGLVDSNTITVSLTPIGMYQELFVEKIENNKIIIKNNSSSTIKCQYLICGERKDTEKNIPEYKGNYEDYPGDNSQYVQYVNPLFK